MNAPASPPDFRAVQRAFSAHLRDPARHAPPPGIEDRRLRIYRELFYNNVEDFLATAYPVLRRLSSDTVWHARVRDFYARHVCTAPQFYRLAEEFLRFIEQARGAHPDDPPFIAELVHYEWVELALAVADAEASPELADPNGDPLEAAPLISPLAWPLAYAYPVQRIGPDFQPSAPPAQPTYLIVWRNRADEVRFMEINAVSARLLQLIEENPASGGRELLTRIATELGHADAAAVIEAGRGMFAQWRERDILLGTRRG
jgi:uncharacterized protein